jgi:NAD(P)-dependent dehydrogenase (short-subunit alcohol dehydrogenase family)
LNLISLGYRLSLIRFSDYNFEKKYEELPDDEKPPKGLPIALLDPDTAFSGYITYRQSKTGNILFSISLNEGLRERGVRGMRAFSVHPGCE